MICDSNLLTKFSINHIQIYRSSLLSKWPQMNWQNIKKKFMILMITWVWSSPDSLPMQDSWTSLWETNHLITGILTSQHTQSKGSLIRLLPNHKLKHAAIVRDHSVLEYWLVVSMRLVPIYSRHAHLVTSTSITQWQLEPNVNQLRHILRKILKTFQQLTEIPS